MGREEELAAARAFLDGAQVGPAALCITGPAGIGKTTLWRALLADAGTRGVRTLTTRAVEAEAQLAFAGLADLLDPVLDEALPALPPAQRVAVEVALQRVPAEGIDPPPLAVSLGVLAALRTLAEAAPVVVAIDDLAWLDGPSARVLEYVARRVAGARISLVAAVREAVAGAPLPALLAGFDGHVERLHVGPLDLPALGDLVRRELGPQLRRPALARLHEESGGNPFVALEIARAVRRTGVEPDLSGLAQATAPDALVRSRLAALPPSTRLPLAAVAALGRPSVAVVTAAVPDAAEALEVARAAGVVGIDGEVVGFAHPLLAAGAYGLLPPAERRGLHATLAAVATDPEERARHLALSVDGQREDVAAQLEWAAGSARSRGASDAAAELALLAAHRTPEDSGDALRRRVIAAGGWYIEAGDPARARVILEAQVARTPPGPARADMLRVLADARSSDDWEAKIRVLEQALDEAATDHRLRAQILEALAQAMWHTARDARRQLELATAAVAEAEAQDDPVARCSAYLVAVFARQSAGEGLAVDLLDSAAALAARVEHLRVFLWPAFVEALTDITWDRLDRAIATLERLAGRAVAAGDWDSPPLLALNLAHALYRRGRWDEALEQALEAERGARLTGQAQALAWALANRATIEASMGREAEARRVAEEGLAAAREIGARIAELDNRAVLGFLELAAGDPAAAARTLEASVRPLLDGGYLDPGPLRALPDWAEALVALDRLEEAGSLLDGFESTARRLDRASAIADALRIRGLAAASRGDEAAAGAAFSEALRHHDRVADPFSRARTLLAHGEMLRRFRRRGAAREALAEAAGIFERLGADRWHARAVAELARTGHREAGDLLSPTERQIAELVAAGRTNREVAEALFMSPHTVEAHLTRAYRSLGVRGRTELARAVAAGLLDGAAGDRRSIEGRG